jgi:aspartyl/asparaginyl-tRNA synthetase
VLAKDLPGHQGGVVRVCGWADLAGDRLLVRDHTGSVELAGHVDPVVPGSAVDVRGTATAGDRIDVLELRVAGPAIDPPPIDDDASLNDRLAWRYIDLRRPRNRLIFEVQTTAERAMRAWWAANGFLELHSPKLRGFPNMSGRELFSVDYFGTPAYLAQSPQFYKQMAMAAGFDRVFEIGPVFRANPLLTSRHDTEFVSVDVEVSWIESHEDLLALEEDWLCAVVAEVAGAHGTEIERLFGRRLHVPKAPFPRITMVEAHEVLAGLGHRMGPAGDIDAEGERLLAAHVAAEHGHELVFVTEYPEAVRPFYHMRLGEGSELTRSFDLLWNGLEVTTGAQREHRHDRLLAQAGHNPSRVDVIRPYLDFFRHGCPPHGGFGFGLTRMLMCLLGVDDVREVTFLPRDRERLTP